MLLSNCATAMSLFCSANFSHSEEKWSPSSSTEMRWCDMDGGRAGLCSCVVLGCVMVVVVRGRSVSCLCVFLHDERFLVQLHDKSHLKFWKFSGFLCDNNYTETYTWFLHVQSKNPEEVGVPCCDNGRMGHVMFPSVLRALMSVLAIFFYIFLLRDKVYTDWNWLKS